MDCDKFPWSMFRVWLLHDNVKGRVSGDMSYQLLYGLITTTNSLNCIVLAGAPIDILH